jgi:hypothetical protein
MTQKIKTFLMFEGRCEEAIGFLLGSRLALANAGSAVA